MNFIKYTRKILKTALKRTLKKDTGFAYKSLQAFPLIFDTGSRVKLPGLIPRLSCAGSSRHNLKKVT